MKKLRWAMDGAFWDVDVSTPRSVDGVARAAAAESDPFPLLPLGLSRGTFLSRPKQLDFMQRFMALPFVPSYSPTHGLSLQRALTFFPFSSSSSSWFGPVLGQFNVQKFAACLRDKPWHSSWLPKFGAHLLDRSLYALAFCSDLLFTTNDALLLSLETDATHDSFRKKAVFHHEFPRHNLTVEAVWPGLFLDTTGAYWDVPLSIAIDLASLPSDSGLSYHLCLHQNVGSPKPHQGHQSLGAPASLQPGLCLKSAFAFKKNIDIWRSTAHKLKGAQPFDIFLSNPHISASVIVGAVATASLADSSVRSEVQDQYLGFKGFNVHAHGLKSVFLTDIFASLSLSAQHGHFQRIFLDLTRISARLDFPSGIKFLSGTTRLLQHIYNRQQPCAEAVKTCCPSAFISLQQQIVGPFSVRVDSRVATNSKNRGWLLQVDEPVFAVEYALQVLGSAKAVAWYSPKHKEFMVELRFFEK